MKVEILILISVILSSISAVDEAVKIMNYSQTIAFHKVITIKFTFCSMKKTHERASIVSKPPVITHTPS